MEHGGENDEHVVNAGRVEVFGQVTLCMLKHQKLEILELNSHRRQKYPHFLVSTVARARLESDKKSPSFAETTVAMGRPLAKVGRPTTRGRVRRPGEPNIKLTSTVLLP